MSLTLDPSQFTLGMQIAAVNREIGLRRAVYPRQIAAGRMREDNARKEIAAMEAVLATLERLRAGEHPNHESEQEYGTDLL